MALITTIRCPHCGWGSKEEVPEDACVIRHECRACGEILRPLERDCCVFCSYGAARPGRRPGGPERTPAGAEGGGRLAVVGSGMRLRDDLEEGGP